MVRSLNREKEIDVFACFDVWSLKPRRKAGEIITLTRSVWQFPTCAGILIRRTYTSSLEIDLGNRLEAFPVEYRLLRVFFVAFVIIFRQVTGFVFSHVGLRPFIKNYNCLLFGLNCLCICVFILLRSKTK